MNKTSVPKDNESDFEGTDGRPPAFQEGEPDNDFDENFNNWLIEAGAAVAGKEFRVYVKRYRENAPRPIHCETFLNRFPGLDEIGAKWGGGKFEVKYNLLRVPKTVNKNYKLCTSTIIELDDAWNDIAANNKEDEKARRAAKMAGGDQRAIGGGSFDNGNSFGQAIGLSQAIINMVKDVMETAAERAPAAPTDMYKNLNAMAEEMVRSNLKTIYGIRNQALREIPFNQANTAAPAAGLQVIQPAAVENPLISVIETVIEEYAPKILGGGVIADQAIEMIKSMLPKFSQVTGDPDAMQTIVNTCCSRLGVEQTKTLFSKIGIPLQ